MNGLGVVCVFSECRGSQAPPYGSTFRSRVERARNPSLSARRFHDIRRKHNLKRSFYRVAPPDADHLSHRRACARCQRGLATRESEIGRA